MKGSCSTYFFLSFANLIRRVMDISKYLRESLGLETRDNESRVYIVRKASISQFSSTRVKLQKNWCRCASVEYTPVVMIRETQELPNIREEMSVEAKKHGLPQPSNINCSYPRSKLHIQSNFNSSNIFGTVETSSGHG